MSQIATTTPHRKLGIDLLRIISMLMVLVLHILGDGKVLRSCEPFSLNYIIGWIMEIVCFCAVNCYGLISGYVGIHAKYKYSNLAVLWLQVFSYSFFITAIFFFITPGDIGGLKLVNSLFPVYKKYLWYFSAYFGLFFLMPLLNRAVLSLSRKQAYVISVVIIVVYTILHTFLPALGTDGAFVINDGYCVMWLVLLYILGACIGHFKLFEKLKVFSLMSIYMICVAITLVYTLIMHADLIPFLGNFLKAESLVNYTSPTILFCGISLVLIASKLEIKNTVISKLCRILAPVSFGVYAIHMHGSIRKIIFENPLIKKFSTLHPLAMSASVIIYAISLFILFASIDHVRLYIFNKLKIKQRLYQLEQKYLGSLWENENAYNKS